MEALQINIQEFAFLVGWNPKNASDYFKNICARVGLEYKPKMKLGIRDLDGEDRTHKLKERAEDINKHYFKRYEQRLKLLNDAKCIENQAWVGKNAAVKVFLSKEDINTIEEVWRKKRIEFYNQQTLFDVKPVLVPPKKKKIKKAEGKVARPN